MKKKKLEWEKNDLAIVVHKIHIHTHTHRVFEKIENKRKNKKKKSGRGKYWFPVTFIRNLKGITSFQRLKS